MANTIIQLRHSTIQGNVPVSLANGEISINTYDGKLFYAQPDGTITEFSGFAGPSGLNGELQFNDSGSLGADSGLTYNKTTDVLTVVGGAIVGGVNVAPQIQFAYNHANAAFEQANTGGGASSDQYARDTANAAYSTANTKDFTFFQDTAPSTANSRDAWIDTDSGVLYKNFGNVTHPVWVETGPTGFSNVSGALDGDLVVSGNITPLTDNVYSLGSASYRFKDVFVGPGSIDIDGLVFSNNNGKLTITGASDLVMSGTQVPSSINVSDHANSAFIAANGTAIVANTADAKAVSAGSYANSAFTKANNALANTSGTLAGSLNITGNLQLTTAENKILNSSGRPILQQSGSVLQVVQAFKTDTFSTTSTSLQDVSGMSVTITPSSSSSKFLIMVNITYLNTFYTGHVALIRNGTEIGMADAASNRPRNFLFYSNSTNAGNDGQWIRESMDYLDSPATSSSITYKIQASARRDGQGGTMFINRSNPDRDTTGYDGRGVSSIVVMEIAG